MMLLSLNKLPPTGRMTPPLLILCTSSSSCDTLKSVLLDNQIHQSTAVHCGLWRKRRTLTELLNLSSRTDVCSLEKLNHFGLCKPVILLFSSAVLTTVLHEIP